ncbi:polysaccharide deacteylase family 2 protein [uncultured Tateyamaria sp.]|uniref:divergent polysaccharide deacetylase family protein n=1 Tax=uncultured Tateyamaria sp. TaxID=455651 RepID=UPI002624B348|nr:polysaccharide deacteylase family 2 protein [uncultured Tateyamaria sp.]
MARGFLSGIIWGGVVSVIGAGAVSVIADDPIAPVAGSTAPSSAIAPEAGQASTAEAVTDADLVVDESAPQVTSPEADTVTAATAAGADTPTVPQTGQADDLADPATASDVGAVEVDDVAPVQPGAPAGAPTEPDAETELSISTEPAQPAPPVVPEAPTAFAPEDDAAPEAPQTPVAEAAAPEAPDVSAAPEVAEADAPAEADAEVAEAEAPTEAETEVVEVPTPPADPEPSEEQGEEIAALPNTTETPSEDARPTIGTPAGTLVDRTADEPAEDTAEAAPTGTRAINAYAAPFENPEDKPLMSIVLMDSGVDLSGGPVGLAALQSFPYPLSFAVDASLPDATTRMAEYRAQGFEVMALMNLPQGATAGDAEVALSAALDAVPEAVAVMEGVGTGLQDSRDTGEQIAQAVLDTGHGLLLQSKGLNTAHKLAVRDGVPAGLIFRDFDSADQSPSTIRRFLDQAAFRAGQEGGVIMVGRVRPDTISALLLWGLQDRAKRVALAPISAVLTALVPGE